MIIVSTATILTSTEEEKKKILDYIKESMNLNEYEIYNINSSTSLQIKFDSGGYGVFSNILSSQYLKDRIYGEYGNFENALRENGFKFDIFEIADFREDEFSKFDLEDIQEGLYLVHNNKIIDKMEID